MLTFRPRELVDCEPVVIVGIVEVDDARLRASNGAVLAAEFDGDALDQHAVDSAVALDQRRRVQPHQLAVGIVHGLSRQVRI